MNKKKSSRSRKPKDDCIRRSPKKPRPIQERVIKYITKTNELYDGLLIVHGTGCGKTLAATIASQCYLDKYPNNKVVFISPASLVENFRDELINYGVQNLDKYEFFSITGFYNRVKQGRRVNCAKSLLIIDEAHNLRTIPRLDRGKRSAAVLDCAYKSHKRLLLTATPFINSPVDFINLINIIHGKEIAGMTGSGAPYIISKTFSQNTMTSLTELLKGRVDYVPSCRDSAEFPKVTETFVEIPMSKDYLKKYQKAVAGLVVGGLILKNPQVFFHGYRKAVNKTGVNKYYSGKLDKTVELLTDKSGKIQKSVIFTNWINFGVKAIEKYLNDKKIPFAVFRGGLSAEVKKDITQRFNNDQFPVLIVTRAGGEGLDLRGVRNLVILDPVWHNSGIEQISGRAVRYRSHTHLPVSQRNVRIMKMVLKFPKGVSGKTGDELLYEIIRKKSMVKQKVDQILKDSSIKTKNPSKVVPGIRSGIKIKRKALETMPLYKLKKFCRSINLTKRDLGGKSLSSFKKADKPELLRIILGFAKSRKSRKYKKSRKKRKSRKKFS